MSYKNDIICDIDGVLCDYTESALKVYSEVYPDDQLAPITDWNMSQFFKHPEAFNKIAFSSEHDGGMAELIAASAPAYPMVSSIFNAFADYFRVHLVTSRPVFLKEITEKWLSDNDFKGFVNLEFRSDKQNYLPKANILIDDGMHNLVDFMKTGRWPICISQPWNRSWPGLRAEDLNYAITIALRIFWFEKGQTITLSNKAA